MNTYLPARLRRMPALLLLASLLTPPMSAGAADAGGVQAITALPRYQARAGREQPLIAVIGENSGSELTDLVIPASLLKQSGKAQVLTVSLNEGPITLRPAGLRLKPDASADQFDASYPAGADYVIVPAVAIEQRANPQLLGWIRSQQEKGATLLSICDGALVLAHAGVLKGKRATAHVMTDALRRASFPDTYWLKDIRYVADGKIITSAGISAAIPTSLALIEAIAGREAADRLGMKYGVSDWSSKHNSEMFEPKFGVNLLPYVVSNYLNAWFKPMKHIGFALYPGMDELELALTMDAYSRTGRSKAIAVTNDGQAITSAAGMVFLPDAAAGKAASIDMILPPLARSEATLFDRVLHDVAQGFGPLTAMGVAYAFEYPWVGN